MKIPPGSYDLLVRKGGYTPGTISVVVGAAAESASLELREANLNSVSVGSATSGSGVPFNTGVSALATLSAEAISRRPEPTLNNLATELAGVTLAHPSAAVPDMSFVVRGGVVETRVQIDGHAVSAGAKWPLERFVRFAAALRQHRSGQGGGNQRRGRRRIRLRHDQLAHA